jgi:hypothetical protein
MLLKATISGNSAANRVATGKLLLFSLLRFPSLCVNHGLMRAMLTDTRAAIDADTKATSSALPILVNISPSKQAKHSSLTQLPALISAAIS